MLDEYVPVASFTNPYPTAYLIGDVLILERQGIGFGSSAIFASAKTINDDHPKIEIPEIVQVANPTPTRRGSTKNDKNGPAKICLLRA